MRWLITIFISVALFGSTAVADSSGKLIKVLPQYLDFQGRTALSPSLYERDAYQATMLYKPELRSGIVFNVQWKAPNAGSLKIFIEARGPAREKTAQTLVWERAVTRHGWFSQWEKISITGDEFRQLNPMTAWRVSLWDGDKLLSEQKSFLW